MYRWTVEFTRQMKAQSALKFGMIQNGGMKEAGQDGLLLRIDLDFRTNSLPHCIV
jgi:hypothetical protein